MTEAPIPGNEAARLRTLRALDILDSESEDRFDRYARLARGLFHVPIALVSLVDADRQWFKARSGLDATETPREASFCAHAILSDAVLVVEDATRDERFRDNPLVCGDPNIRFYAGYPLKTPDGLRMGTLCIIDRRPRTLSAEKRRLLDDLGAMLESELGALYMATVDALTGLCNRRGLDRIARHVLGVCERAGLGGQLLFLDLDGFKTVNDRHGHVAGDRALAEFARIMVECFRDSDAVARIGGDEFCVLLAGATPEQAEQAVARLRSLLAARVVDAGGGGPLSFSAGIVSMTPGRGLGELLADADARMYAEKSSRTDHAPQIKRDAVA